MSKTKGGLSSTMQNAFGETVSDKGKAGDHMDANPCPYFDKKHDMGPNTIPVVITTSVNGKDYHGKVDEVAANVLNTTMNFDKK